MSCKRILRSHELIPIISFLLRGGKCATCEAKLSWQYPAVELGSGGLFILALFIAPTSYTAAILSLALWLLLLISFIDARIQGIPDALSVPFIALSLLYGSLLGELELLSFTIGVGFFGLQWLLSKGKWIGSGDILLMVGLSALLGKAEMVLFMLLIAYITGAIVASVLLLKRKMHRKTHIAFGPFLAFGTLVTLIIGDKVTSCLLWSANACTGLLFF